MLSLGLPSFPPNPQAGAQHGAIIAIRDAARATAAFRRSFWPFCMRGRRDNMRHSHRISTIVIMTVRSRAAAPVQLVLHGPRRVRARPLRGAGLFFPGVRQEKDLLD